MAVLAPVAPNAPAPETQPLRTRRTVSPGRIIGWVVLIASLVLTVFPFYWMVKTALTPAADVIADSGSLFPTNPTFINFLLVVGLVSPEEARSA